MNKQLVTGIGIGVVVAATIGAFAGYRISHQEPATAAVSGTAALTVDGDSLAQPGEMAAQITATTAAVESPTGAPAPVAPRQPTARPNYAVVLSSAAVTEIERVAREECKDVEVTRQKAVKDEQRIAGSAIGAIVGGVVGNQIGDGDGKKLATAAGAVAGGYAGSKIQKRAQEGNMETVLEQQCETVYDDKQKTVGYDVRYRYDGAVQTVRMSSDQGVGTRLPVQNGRVAAR